MLYDSIQSFSVWLRTSYNTADINQFLEAILKIKLSLFAFLTIYFCSLKYFKEKTVAKLLYQSSRMCNCPSILLSVWW